MPARMSAWRMPGQLTRMVGWVAPAACWASSASVTCAGEPMAKRLAARLREAAPRAGGGIERDALEPPRQIGRVLLEQVGRGAADRDVLVGRADHLEQPADLRRSAAGPPRARAAVKAATCAANSSTRGPAPPASRRRCGPRARCRRAPASRPGWAAAAAAAGRGRMLTSSKLQCRPRCVTWSSVHSRRMISTPSASRLTRSAIGTPKIGELLRAVAEPDAEHEPPAGDHVEERADLGQLDRVVQRQQHQIGPDATALGTSAASRCSIGSSGK